VYAEKKLRKTKWKNGIRKFKDGRAALLDDVWDKR